MVGQWEGGGKDPGRSEPSEEERRAVPLAPHSDSFGALLCP